MAGGQQERHGDADDGYAGAPLPDSVWQRFLDDSEGAIGASAPREPSARERAAGIPARARRAAVPGPEQAATVGELWDAREPAPTRRWRDLDARARCRRVGGFVAAGVVAVVLGYLSLGQVRPAVPGGSPEQEMSQTSVDVLPDGTPNAPRFSPGPVRTPVLTVRDDGDTAAGT
ncbi:hypothetical protein [Streptomyces sp. NPDC101249]|uniref:hypothetical protein n=1 Tax=Streptomyces sp. NPDC101249 TaxID=3366140 RepID=UPI00381F79D0